MLVDNPWQVRSIQAFSCLKCPECTFITKEESEFQTHAVQSHPLSYVGYASIFFGKLSSTGPLLARPTPIHVYLHISEIMFINVMKSTNNMLH